MIWVLIWRRQTRSLPDADRNRALAALDETEMDATALPALIKQRFAADG
jgi:hypothetical protein